MIKTTANVCACLGRFCNNAIPKCVYAQQMKMLIKFKVLTSKIFPLGFTSLHPASQAFVGWEEHRLKSNEKLKKKANNIKD